MRTLFLLACLGSLSIGCGGIVRDSGADAITLDSTPADTYVPTRCDAIPVKCPADPPPPPDAIATCERERTGRCGPQYQALLDCAYANFRCGPDGKADGTYLMTMCKTQVDGYTRCYTPTVDGGIGP